MKLNKLKIQNIASISYGEIDFNCDKLINEPIFLISGKTGSGKSTIIDAICLALYDNTPRSKNSGLKTEQSDREIIRKGQSSASIILEFSGNDSYAYRASWNAHFARNKVDGTITIQRELYCISSDTVLATKTKEFEEYIQKQSIVGLDFLQFCRTTVLAQGDFSQFLKAKEDEKAQILQKLTSTEIYSLIGKRIFDKHKEVKENIDSINKILSSISNFTQEDKEKKIAEKEEVNKQLGEIKVKLDILAKYIDCQKNINNLYLEKKNIENSKDKIIEDYKTLLSNINYYNTKLLQINNSIEQYNNYLQINSSKIPMLENSGIIVQNLKNAVSQKEIMQKNLEFLSNAKGQLEKITPILANKTSHLNNVKKEVEQIQKNQEQLQNQINNLQTYEKLNFELSQANNLFVDFNFKKQELENLEKSYNQENQELTLLKEKQISLKDNYQKLELEYKNQELIFIKQKEVTASWALSARNKLTVGDRCPVCQHLIDENDYHFLHNRDFNDVLKPIEDDLNKKKEILENANKSLNEISANILAKQKNLDSVLKVNFNNSKENLNILQKNLNEIFVKLNFDKSIEEFVEFLKEKQKIVDENLLLLKQKRDLLQKLFEELKGKNKLSQELEKEVKDIEKEQNRLNEDIVKFSSQKTQSANLCASFYNKAKEQIFDKNNWEENFKQNPELFIKNLQESANDFNIKTKANQTDISNKKLLDETLEFVLGQKEKICQKFANLAQISNFNEQTNKDIKNFASSILQTVSTYFSKINDNKNKLEEFLEIQKNLGQNYPQFKGFSLEELQENNQNLSLENSNQNKNLGKIQNEISQIENDIKKRQGFENQIKELGQELSVWEELYQEFGDKEGKKFSKIAMGFLFLNLLNYANYYLKTFRPRYSLVKKDNLEIYLKDEYFDSLRHYSQLSGGESFIVSLSLALALSSIGNKNLDIQTLFIDEGFGSLDQESLAIVIDTLDSLHSTGKRIGVISHVEQLKERIASHIELIPMKNDASCSEIFIV